MKKLRIEWLGDLFKVTQLADGRTGIQVHVCVILVMLHKLHLLAKKHACIIL